MNILPHEAPSLLSNVFKFYTLQYAAREYFNVLEYIGLRQMVPGPEVVSRQQRRDFDKKEAKRIEKIKESSTRYRKSVSFTTNQVTEDLSESQRNALEEVSIFFVDVLEKIDLFTLRNDKREEFLKDLEELAKKYK